MLDGTVEHRMQRSQGAAFASFRLAGGMPRLADLAQSGSAKVMLPRHDGPVPEVVFLNTSGGLTGGDDLSYRIDVGAGCRVLATTQTAERGYASLGDAALIRVQAQVGAGGRLDWLPQETLIYEASHLVRRTEIDLAADAHCLLAESVVLGRQAMGEVPRSARLLDHRMIRREGRPVWAETFRLDPAVLANSSPALLAGAKAFAVVALVAHGAQDGVGPLRNLPAVDGCQYAVSGWDGRCLVRLTAVSGWPLRLQLAGILRVLTGRNLPRVWQSGGIS